MNKIAEEIFGYSAEEAIGCDIADRFDLKAALEGSG